MNVFLLGYGDTETMQLLRACCSSAATVVLVDHASRGSTDSPAESIEQAERKMRLTLTSEMMQAFEPEQFVPEPPPARAAHWQKHDRLPFYHGVRSRKQRKRK